MRANTAIPAKETLQGITIRSAPLVEFALDAVELSEEGVVDGCETEVVKPEERAVVLDGPGVAVEPPIGAVDAPLT